MLRLAVELELDPRVAAWVRGGRLVPSRTPSKQWEPVVYSGGRRVVRRSPPPDALVHYSRPRRTDPGRVVGMKPAAFVWWMLDLIGAEWGDDVVDLFPGSGGIARAWRMLDEACRRAVLERDRQAAFVPRYLFQAR